MLCSTGLLLDGQMVKRMLIKEDKLNINKNGAFCLCMRKVRVICCAFLRRLGLKLE